MIKASRIILQFFLLILVIGCSTSNTNKTTGNVVSIPTENIESVETRPIVQKYYPISIVEFSSADEGELIRFYFQVQNENGIRVPAEGDLNIKIYDNSDNLIYENNYKVSSTSYLDYQIMLTGQQIGKAYEWKVPIKDIKKGYSNYGKAEITFTSEGKRLTKKDEFVTIPSYSEEEIATMFEQEYQNSKSEFLKILKRDNFEMTIIAFGFYKQTSFSNINEVFRMDFVVRNIGKDAEYFSPNGMSIIDNEGNQYEISYGGTLDTFKKMFPKTKQEGYVIFDKVPKDISSAKLVFELGYTENFKPISFEVKIPIK